MNIVRQTCSFWGRQQSTISRRLPWRPILERSAAPYSISNLTQFAQADRHLILTQCFHDIPLRDFNVQSAHKQAPQRDRYRRRMLITSTQTLFHVEHSRPSEHHHPGRPDRANPFCRIANNPTRTRSNSTSLLIGMTDHQQTTIIVIKFYASLCNCQQLSYSLRRCLVVSLPTNPLDPRHAWYPPISQYEHVIPEST